MKPSEQKLTLFHSVVFVFLPLILGLSTMFYSLDRLDESLRERKNRELFKTLDTLIVRQDGGLPFLQNFRSFLMEIRYFWGDNNYIQRSIEGLEEGLKTKVRIYVFQYGRVVYKTHEHIEDKLVQEVVTALLSDAEHLQEVANRLDPEIRASWGKEHSLNLIQRRNGEFFLFDETPESRLGFFETRSDGLGIVFVSERLQPDLTRSFRSMQKTLQPMKSFLGKAIPELRIWHPPDGIPSTAMERAYGQAVREAKTRVELNGFSWFFRKDRWGKLFALAVPQEIYSPVVTYGKTALLLFSGFIAFAWFWLSKMGRTGFARFLGSIQQQLWFLFFYVTFLPLLAALAVGLIVLGDKTEQLRHLGFKNCFERLQSIEGSYPEARKKFEILCQGIRNNRIVMEAKDPPLASMVADLRFERRIDYVCLFSADQDIIFHNLFNRDKALLMAIQGLCRQGILNFAMHRIEPDKAKKFNALDMMVDGMVTSDEMGYSTLVQYRNHLHEMRMARATVDLYWDVYPEQATGPAFIAIVIDRDQILMRHLREKFTSPNTPNTLTFMHLLSGKLINPVNPPDKETIREAIYVAEKMNQVVQQEVQLASGPVWIAAMPDTMISRVGMAAMCYADSSLAELNPFKLALSLGLLLSLLVAGIAGKVLAGLFLVPIADLTMGIEAIRLRQTNVRIPRRREDEFGELVVVFNRMLAELHELEIAKIVQGQLLPREYPQLAGYEITAKNVTATDLGGDYFDLVPLPSGKLVMVMGDATGHGVSAALAMAMAKATVSNCVHEGHLGCDEIINSLNHVFFEELRAQRKFMTLLLGILNPDDHSIEFRNAGHPYPIFFREGEKKLESPDMIGFPLGLKKKSHFFSGMSTMGPGDIMILYTDGYTECEIRKEEFIETHGLMAAFEATARKGSSAQQILEDLFAYFEKVRIPGPLADDVTIIVIKRR